ncbi:MAG: hypothetical protein KMY54_10760, partial [Erysipelothrix sp.]|nr:hypothetical protein [Erysipelothrix sp.]
KLRAAAVCQPSLAGVARKISLGRYLRMRRGAEAFRNYVLEKLAGYDCGACGYPSCRVMAEEIVAGNSTLADCRIIHVKEI